LVAGPETEEHAKLRATEERVQVASQRLRTLEHQRPRLEAELEARRKTADATSEDIAAAEQRLTTLDRRILKTRAKLDSARLELDDLLTSGNGAS
jgi:flagellar biosynthesis chaperone FliJ